MQLIFLENWLGNETVKALGWTFFHSLWIGLLAAVFAGLIILLTRRSSARLRYQLLNVVLICFVSACVVTFFLQGGSGSASGINGDTVGSTVFTTDTLQVNETITSSKSFIAVFTDYFNANADYLVFAWAIFFLLHSIKLITGLAGVSRLRHYKTELPNEEWLYKLKELSMRLGISQSVALLESRLIKVPVAIGVLKPVILVPLGLLSKLPPDQVETILLHELAHIRRQDYLVNIFQRMAEAVFFFNPALRWLCSLIRQEREACCDDIVVSATGQKIHYLEALVAFQEYATEAPEYAMAIRDKKNYLLSRVQRLLTRENKKLNIMEKIALLSGLILFTAFRFIPNHNANTIEKTVAAERVKHSWSLQPAAMAVNQPVISKPESGQDAYHAVEISSQPVNKIIVPDQPAGQIRDTVPTIVYDRVDTIRFKSVSTTTADDGVTKKETIVAVDQNGRKYAISRLNNKVTHLQVDDKVIPENEIESYAPLLRVLDKKRENNKAHKEKDLEEKKVRIAETRKDAAELASKRKEEMIEKRIDEKRKALETDRKGLNEKRKELADIQNELKARKKEMMDAEAKNKGKIETEIRNKEKAIDDKLKQIEADKKKMQLKKDAIGEDKKKLEKEKKEPKEKPNPVTGTNTKEVKLFTRNAISVSRMAKADLYEEKIIAAKTNASIKIAAIKASTGESRITLQDSKLQTGRKYTVDAVVLERKAVVRKISKPTLTENKDCPPVK